MHPPTKYVIKLHKGLETLDNYLDHVTARFRPQARRDLEDLEDLEPFNFDQISRYGYRASSLGTV